MSFFLKLLDWCFCSVCTGHFVRNGWQSSRKLFHACRTKCPADLQCSAGHFDPQPDILLSWWPANIESCRTKCPARSELSAGHQQNSAGHVRHILRGLGWTSGNCNKILRMPPVNFIWGASLFGKYNLMWHGETPYHPKNSKIVKRQHLTLIVQETGAWPKSHKLWF